MKKVRTFCKLSQKGFIVAEINDLITKDEFVGDLLGVGQVAVLDLRKLSEIEERLKIDNKADILVIDEVASSDIERIVINLNFNRDWFLRLNKKVVFILPTITVNRLIEYSYSFWSFVYLHVAFNTKFPSIVKPHYIFDLLSYNNKKSQEVDKGIYRSVYNTTRSASSVISSYNDRVSSNRNDDLSKVLMNRMAEINFSDEKSIEYGYMWIFSLGKSLLREAHYKEALKCFQFLIKRFVLGDDQKQRDYELKKNIAFVCYQLGDYLTALNYVNQILVSITENDQLRQEYQFLSLYELASLWNNTGVLMYLSGGKKQALSMFNKAAELINDVHITFHIGEILFNLCLVSMNIEDYRNASYYIDKAIEAVDQYTNRSMNILSARYKVLKAYLLVNTGAICEAKELIHPNLVFLRSEILENHEYIMQAHFVYGLIYLHNNELEKAQKCALKAYDISRRVKSSLQDRARIFQLLGEIHFYLGDYINARRYLYHASRQSNVFTREVMDWMEWAQRECSKMLE